MIYREGSSLDGGLSTGSAEGWELFRSDGSYDDGHDFLYVHWEIHDRYPNVIHLHVESPRFSVDPSLNLLKRSIINSILNSGIEQKVGEKGFEYKLGSLIKDSDIKNNKSTAVFRVILSPDQSKLTHRENLELVHNALGSYISDILGKFVKKFDEQSLVSEYY